MLGPILIALNLTAASAVVVICVWAGGPVAFLIALVALNGVIWCIEDAAWEIRFRRRRGD